MNANEKRAKLEQAKGYRVLGQHNREIGGRETVTLRIGDKVTVWRSGAGHSIFGEEATLVRATKQHLVFRTNKRRDGSVDEVKASLDCGNLNTVGKARASWVNVSPYAMEAFKEGREFYHSPISL